MQLTQESRRARWLIMLAVWLGCGALVVLHTQVIRDYIGLLDQAGGRAAAVPATPLRQVIPARYADAQMWVRHVLAAETADVSRVRATAVDNAPLGREVHWSSVFNWLMRAAGRLHRALTADGWPLSLERALLWFNAPLFMGVVIVLSAWVARRMGAGPGALIALAMLGHPRFYEGFSPAYVDHHGLVTALVLGLLLGAAFMGAGWWRPAKLADVNLLPATPEAARSAAFISAMLGGLGLWVSAAAVLPAIALIGAAGLAVGWWHGRSAQQEGAAFDPQVWRVWGRSGAITSLACYLIEYAPAHLGLRLEVNHPLYSLGWWGGAEVVALLAPCRVERAFSLRGVASRLLLPGLAVAAAPLTIVMGGSAVFMVRDPFVGDLRHFVAEGRSFASALRQFGWRAVVPDLVAVLLLLPVAWFGLRQRGVTGIVLGLLTGGALGFVVMGLGEMRWWLNGSAAQIVLLLFVLVVVAAKYRRLCRYIVPAVALGFLIPAIQRVVVGGAENARGQVAAGDLLQPLYREIAAALRAGQPDGEIVLLANPNASAGIAYFGGFKSLGTLFWENAPGLRAAAEIFSAPDDTGAWRLLHERGVTHVVLISTANFLGEYFQLLHPTKELAEARNGFGYRLMANPAEPPRWLQAIPFRRPPELAQVGGDVTLFRVAPDQTEPERLFHAGSAQAALGQIEKAETLFARALAIVPPPEQVTVCVAAAEMFYEFGADAPAVRLFRRALAKAYDPEVANTAAWILATTSDETLRDGQAALGLVQPLWEVAANNPSVLSTIAAASAEVGRYGEAVQAAERALHLVRVEGDREAESLLEQRLNHYRANRPWRQ